MKQKNYFLLYIIHILINIIKMRMNYNYMLLINLENKNGYYHIMNLLITYIVIMIYNLDNLLNNKNGLVMNYFLGQLSLMGLIVIKLYRLLNKNMKNT